MPNAGVNIIVGPDGISYLRDVTRGKILSIDRKHMRAGRKHPSVSNQSLRVEDGQPLSTVGDLMPRNATITGLRANCELATTWNFDVLKKGTTTVIATLPVIAANQASNNFVNVDLNAGDVIIFKLTGLNVPHPRVEAEIAWRL